MNWYCFRARCLFSTVKFSFFVVGLLAGCVWGWVLGSDSGVVSQKTERTWPASGDKQGEFGERCSERLTGTRVRKKSHAGDEQRARSTYGINYGWRPRTKSGRKKLNWIFSYYYVCHTMNELVRFIRTLRQRVYNIVVKVRHTRKKSVSVKFKVEESRAYERTTKKTWLLSSSVALKVNLSFDSISFVHRASD